MSMRRTWCATTGIVLGLGLASCVPQWQRLQYPDPAAETADEGPGEEDSCKKSRSFASGFLKNGSVRYIGRRAPDGAGSNDWIFTYAEGIRKGTSATMGVRDGVRHGPFKVEAPNGKTLVTGTFTNGKRAGEWTYRYPSGRLLAKGRMKDGVRCGTWEHFDEDGSDRDVPEGEPCD
jgi:hypothetical protein